MRLADHQPQWAELEAAGGISQQPFAAIRRRAGAARRSAGAAGAALLRRQQGAVVRDHRRSAAISGISAGLGPAARRRQVDRCAAQYGRQYQEVEAVAQYPIVTARTPSTR